MKKNTLLLFLIILLSACNDTEKKTSDTTDSATAVSVQPEVSTAEIHIEPKYNPIDELKQPHMQQALLDAIDSWYKQKGDSTSKYKEDNQVVTLTDSYLKDFFADADLSKVNSESGASRKYDFKKSLAPYRDSSECMDEISLRHIKEDDSYLFQVTNYYMVDEDGRSECYGSDKLIRFRMNGQEISIIDITYAG
ncbi:hypothetical protein [Pedobacter metabolipauper]|uniref:Lipoprotein n=1 Tax=Pedobacter metabolipauper TaxID=425513 RepID=A0A4R6SRB8_9SPHI|nr:hypothetical protein [Pedobacter metabolipauper]TDQ06180.1 hypothetical protein ATK78_4561 [Pedobacter metabolipauper]